VELVTLTENFVTFPHISRVSTSTYEPMVYLENLEGSDYGNTGYWAAGVRLSSGILTNTEEHVSET
jgi:hypothetical protein